MEIKQILLAALCTACFFRAYSQSIASSSDQKKPQQFYFSVDAGLYRPLVTSNPVFKMADLSSDFTLPFASSSFGAGCNGAYFFTKNYGIGIKYYFYTAKDSREAFAEYVDPEDVYEYPIYESIHLSFKEQTHFFGPAVFGRWFLGGYRWSLSAHAGVIYLYDKLSKIKQVYRYIFDTNDLISSPFPLDSDYRFSDHTGGTIGFTLSAGIRYRITSVIGVGVYANGLFASLSQMKYYSPTYQEYVTADISRKVNRIGLSAGLDFTF
jgi:hypothetical protein